MAKTTSEVKQTALEAISSKLKDASAEDILFLTKSIDNLDAKSGGASGNNAVEFLLKDNGDHLGSITFSLNATDIKHSEVDYLEVVTTGVAFSSDAQLRVEALNVSGSKMSGYMGVTWSANYSGGSHTNSSTHNSNNGYIWFPVYRNIRRSSYGYYGGGMNMSIKIPVKAITRSGSSYTATAPISYTTYGWDTSCSTYPENERGTWSNKSNNQGWNQDIYGLKLYGSSGNFTDGTVKVVVHLKPKKVGA